MINIYNTTRQKTMKLGKHVVSLSGKELAEHRRSYH